MQIDQAIAIIEEYRQDYGIGFLEALIEIRQNPEEFSEQQLIAYRVFTNDARQMFQAA